MVICPDSVVALTAPVVMVPVTVRSDSAPISVIAGWAAVDSVPTMVVPVTDESVMPPLTVSEFSVPTAVMLGCDAVLTVPATRAKSGTALANTSKLASN